MKTEWQKYGDNQEFQGFIAWPDSDLPAPVVIVVHAWGGKEEHYEDKARAVAELGYIGFAADMYAGATPTAVEDKVATMGPLVADDRAVLRSRINQAVAFAKTIDNADTTKMAGIGFCFGGVTLLEYARAGGSELQGIVGFHAALGAGTTPTVKDIAPKVLILHGDLDPMVPHEDLLGFYNEMRACNANWEVVSYGNAYHTFTDYRANNQAGGMMYSEQAHIRSWKAMQNFFDEIFAD